MVLSFDFRFVNNWFGHGSLSSICYLQGWQWWVWHSSPLLLMGLNLTSFCPLLLMTLKLASTCPNVFCMGMMNYLVGKSEQNCTLCVQICSCMYCTVQLPCASLEDGELPCVDHVASERRGCHEKSDHVS